MPSLSLSSAGMLQGGSVDGMGVTGTCGIGSGDATTGVEVCWLFVAFATTWQLPPFSQPQPSPSKSKAAELQGGEVSAVTLLPLSIAGVELVVVETTTQLLLFSHPQPSPSWSEEGELQVAMPVVVDPLPVVLVPDEVATIQLALFSHPHPSPSGSAPGELQTVAERVVDTGLAEPDTIQLSPFSQPHPSPLLSEVELTQIGVFANVAEESASIATVGMRLMLSLFMSVRLLQPCRGKAVESTQVSSRKSVSMHVIDRKLHAEMYR